MEVTSVADVVGKILKDWRVPPGLESALRLGEDFRLEFAGNWGGVPGRDEPVEIWGLIVDDQVVASVHMRSRYSYETKHWTIIRVFFEKGVE